MSHQREELFIGMEGGYIVVLDSFKCTCQAVLHLYNSKVLHVIPLIPTILKSQDKYQIFSCGIGFKSLSKEVSGENSSNEDTADIITWEGGLW